MKRSLNPAAALGPESGQSLAFMALATFFLLFMLAVVSETVFVWMQRRDLQNAADAAALAGAQALPDDPAQAIADAKAWAAKNVEDLSFNEADVLDGNLTVRATVRKPASTIFVGLFSFGAPTITAHAAATVRAPLLPGPGVVPMAIDDEAYEDAKDSPGNSITLKEFSGNNSEPQSSYQLLDLPGGSGASDVCDFLIGGGTQGITDPVDSKSGNVSSLHNCLVVRMDAASANGCTGENVLDVGGELRDACNPYGGAGRNADGVQPTAVIVIPVVKNFCNGNCGLDIVGDGEELRTFAFFLIDRKTVEAVDDEGPTCAPPSGGNGDSGQGKNEGGGNDDKEQPSGQCWITGRLLFEYPMNVAPGGLPVGDYDPDGFLKVIQLTE